MKKKLFMALGIALALLACLGLFSFVTGIGDVSAALKEAAAENTSTTRIYLGAVTDALTVLVMIVAAVVCFAVAFEDGGVGYEVSEDEEEEGEPQEEYDEDDEEEDPDEQVARLEEQKRAEEEKANAPKGLSEKFLKNKKGKNKKGKREEEQAQEETPVPQEPCLQCKTCVHRLGDINHCRVYERKPSYIKNNRFACNEYKQK